MHKILQDRKLKKQTEIYDEYDKSLIRLAEMRNIKLMVIKAEIDIMDEGWQAFENGQSLDDNPFIIEGLDDNFDWWQDFDWWQEGWEEAMQAIEDKLNIVKELA